MLSFERQVLKKKLPFSRPQPECQTQLCNLFRIFYCLKNHRVAFSAHWQQKLPTVSKFASKTCNIFKELGKDLACQRINESVFSQQFGSAQHGFKELKRLQRKVLYTKFYVLRNKALLTQSVLDEYL